MNLANTTQVFGDLAGALEGYLRTLRLMEELGNHRDTGQVLNNIGSVYRQQGSYDLAVDHFERAMEIHRTNQDQDGIAETWWNLAMLDESKGRHESALRYARSSLEIYQRIGRRGSAAGVLRSLGAIYRGMGDYQASRAHYGRSLDLYRELGQRGGAAEALTDVAELAIAEGRDEEALRLAASAHDEAREIELQDTVWRAATAIGGVELRRGRHQEAEVAFQQAIDVIEGLRRNAAGDDQDRSLVFEQQMEPYRGLVALLVAEGDHERAFAAVERTKARALLDVLERGEARIVGAMTAEEEARERVLVDRLAFLNTERRFTSDESGDREAAERVASLDRRVERARLELDLFRAELYSLHPELEVNRGEARPIGASEAAALVDSPARAILSFFVAPEVTYLFVLAKDLESGSPRLSVHPLPVPQESLAREVEQFRLGLARLDPRFSEPARRLYDLLIAPAAERLAGRTELVIAPDGVLWDLPFQALQSTPGRYLIEDLALSYAPSLTVLEAMSSRRRQRPEPAASAPTLLALGNPDFGAQTRERVERVLMGGTLAPLPEAERQVDALAALYGPTRVRTYVGAEAREDRVKSEAGAFRILQFATHGTFNDVSPMYSHLVLAQPVGGHEDGLLEAWEMMNLDLDADLVVLAACETARGRVPAGEGVIGISWALFVAGTSTTVVSQWKVESASTTELMLAFHYALRADDSGAADGAFDGVARRRRWRRRCVRRRPACCAIRAIAIPSTGQVS